METKHNKETLRTGLVTGLNGVLEIIEFKKKPLKPRSFKIALSISVAFFLVVLILGIPAIDAIQEIVSQALIFLPTVLGFTIGGYGFLIGFVQPGLMNKISEPRTDSVFSLFQLASASFASNILIQGMTLAIMYVIHFVIWIDQKSKFSVSFPKTIIQFINFLGLILSSFAFALSVAVIIQIVINVFNFSQLHHYNINKDKVDEALKNKNVGIQKQ